MEGKVLLQDLAQSLATKNNIQRKDAEAFAKAFFETISDGILQDKIVKIKGLGTFKMIEVQDRESVNVNTGERIVIPGHSKISFTPDAELKDQVNKPFALFQTVIINEGTSLEDMEKIDSLEENEVPVVIQKSETSEMPESREISEESVNAEDPNVALAIPMSSVATPVIEEPKETEEEIISSVNSHLSSLASQQSTHANPCWWYVSPAMLALLFAFFWIVLLIGYFVGNNKWIDFEQIIKRPSQEILVKVDTVFVEKPVELDSVYIQNIEDSLRNVIQEDNRIKKEQLKASAPRVAKSEPSPIVSNKQKPISYEIVGQKGVRPIKWGDYLLKIVREEYGNEDALKYVISYNNFKDPNNLPVGTEVKLPKLRVK